MQELIPLLKRHALDPLAVEYLFAEGRQEKSYVLKCPPATAMPYWQTLRRIVIQTKYWPVLLGGVEDVDFLRRADDLSWRPVRELIEESQAIDGATYLSDAWKRCVESGGEEFLERIHGEWEPPDYEKEEAERWRDSPIRPAFRNYTYTEQSVFLALVPTPKSWEAPAWLHYGGFNGSPSPAEHVSVLRYWCECYGAELVGIGYHGMDVIVAHPPKTRSQAMALAQGHYVYSPELFDMERKTLEALADELLSIPDWYFWWD